MKSPRLYLVLLFALTTVGVGLLCWQQHQELLELRAAAMNHDERADLQRKIWDLEKRNRELDVSLAGYRALGGGEPGGLAREGDPAARRDRGPGGLGGSGGRDAAALQSLMTKPEVQALLTVQQRAAVEARYAALFKSLNLAPEQLEKFKALLADRGNTMLDLFSIARDQGIDPRQDPEGFRKLLANAQDEFNASLKSTISDAAFAQYQNFEQTQSQRNVVNQLQQRLSYTDTPLTTAQADQLVQILAANSPTARGTSATGSLTPPVVVGAPTGGGDFGAMGLLLGGGGGGNAAPITSTAVNQAQAVLSGPQLTALQQLQQQQQAQQQLQQILRDTVSATQNATARGGPVATPPPTTKKGGG